MRLLQNISLLSAVILFLGGCQKSTPFSIHSSDGKASLTGEQITINRTIASDGPYAFTDSWPPERVGKNMIIDFNGVLLEIPDSLAKKMANPAEIKLTHLELVDGSGSISLEGGSGAGNMTMTLIYENFRLHQASVMNVADDDPVVMYR